MVLCPRNGSEQCFTQPREGDEFSPFDLCQLISLALNCLFQVQGQLNVLQHKYNEISIKYERTLAELDRSRETKHRLECELQEAKADLCTFESDKNLFDHERSLMTQEVSQNSIYFQLT